MPLARLALPALIVTLTGCAGGVVVVAEPDRVVLGGGRDAQVQLQPQADRICGQGGKRAVYAGQRQAGTISGWHYTYRCE